MLSWRGGRWLTSHRSAFAAGNLQAGPVNPGLTCGLKTLPSRIRLASGAVLREVTKYDDSHCCAVRTVIHSLAMAIKSIKHKGLELFHRNNKAAKIQAKHKVKLKAQLTALEAASVAEDMNLPGYKFHTLEGHKKNKRKVYSIWVNGNWRVTFEFENGDAYVVDYKDYH